jgi:uncharacterized tellurite resistance protein B-like protein
MQRYKLQQIEQRVLAKGWLDESDLEELRGVLHDDWQISRPEADFLARLRQHVHDRAPAFDEFFYQAVISRVVKDGRVSAAEAQWLREVIFADRKVDEGERELLRRVRAEVKQASPEFEALYRECLEEAQGASAGGSRGQS